MAISMLKIRRPLGRLIFNMGIAIPGKTVFLIEMAPCSLYDFDGLVQERRNSSALTMESHLSCINPLIWTLQQRADSIKILSYQYRKSYCGKRQFYNCPISSYTGNTSLKTVFILRHGTGLLWHDIAYSITRIRHRSNSECTRDNLIRP